MLFVCFKKFVSSLTGLKKNIFKKGEIENGVNGAIGKEKREEMTKARADHFEMLLLDDNYCI